MQLSLILISIILVCFAVLIIFRKYYVKSTLALKKEKRYDEYFKRLDSKFARIGLPKINRYYMILNGYKDLKDYPKVDAIIDEMLKLDMSPILKEDFDFHQTHYYIFRNDQKYIDIFMKRLEKQENKKYLKIAQYAIDVILNERNDLIKEVDVEIDYLKGNNLGIACYLIALQYLRLGDARQAKLYFQSAVVVTINCIYDYPTKKYLKELESVEAATPMD